MTDTASPHAHSQPGPVLRRLRRPLGARAAVAALDELAAAWDAR